MFKYLAYVTCLIIISLSCLHAQDSTLTRLKRSNLSQKHYENGVIYFNNESYENAIEEFEKSISLNAFDHLAYYFKGLSYEKLNNLPKALLNFNLSLSVLPDFSEALFSRALVYYNLEEYNNAFDDFERLLTLPEGETQAVYFRGVKYGQDDKDTGFNEIISMYNKEADIYNYMGLSCYRMGFYDQSKTYYSEALKRNPDDDNISVNAGLNYLAMGNLDSAKYYFQKSLLINPYNSIAKLNLSLCNPESTDDQIRQLDELILEKRDFPMAYAQRAYQYFVAGNYTAAVADYDTALMLDHGNIIYLLERGILYVRINEFDRAISDFESVISLDENNDQAWYNLANAHFNKKNYVTSIEYYSHAIGLSPDIPDFYYNRSLAFYYSKELDKACKDMKKAQSLGSRNAEHFIQKYCR